MNRGISSITITRISYEYCRVSNIPAGSSDLIHRWYKTKASSSMTFGNDGSCVTWHWSFSFRLFKWCLRSLLVAVVFTEGSSRSIGCNALRRRKSQFENLGFRFSKRIHDNPWEAMFLIPFWEYLYPTSLRAPSVQFQMVKATLLSSIAVARGNLGHYARELRWTVEMELTWNKQLVRTFEGYDKKNSS